MEKSVGNKTVARERNPEGRRRRGELKRQIITNLHRKLLVSQM